jgi:hypothetical protein
MIHSACTWGAYEVTRAKESAGDNLLAAQGAKNRRSTTAELPWT